MEINKLFKSSHHAFRNGRFCLSQLLAHFDLVTKLMEGGKSVEVIYLDFSKAFNKVDMGVTLEKLKSIGMNGKVGRWLQSFLTGRQQSVVINREQSDPQPVVSGVPRGSVLGPLLFLVLIGDIDEGVVSSFLSSFADDTRITYGISKPKRHWRPSCCLSVGLEKTHGVQFRKKWTPKVFTSRISPNWNNLSGRQRPGSWSEIQP